MRIVAALGGNALLRRGQTLSAPSQQATIREAATLLAELARRGHQLTVTHGNGPQVGLLALQSSAGPPESVLPLDVLDAESEGWIGYAIELELRNALSAETELVTLLTQIRVDASDTAFSAPAKPIGPVYDEGTARRLAADQGWSIAADGQGWRRVVASPQPLEIVEIAPLRRLIEAGVLVVCAGGGGIPVAFDSAGRLVGVEAVVDKDAASGLLAEKIDADLFVMLTDVDAVYLDYGTPQARAIAGADPAALASSAAEFHAGSMGPKVAAACGFVRATGKRAAIGALADIVSVIDGTAGTTISGDLPGITYR